MGRTSGVSKAEGTDDIHTARTLLLLLLHQDLRGALLRERSRRRQVVAKCIGRKSTTFKQVLLESSDLLPESVVLVPTGTQFGSDGIEEAIALRDVELESGYVLCKPSVVIFAINKESEPYPFS